MRGRIKWMVLAILGFAVLIATTDLLMGYEATGGTASRWVHDILFALEGAVFLRILDD